MSNQITISLWNLPHETSLSDVERFVTKKLSDAEPDVKPILYNPSSGLGFTTVTLKGRTRPACMSAYKKLAADNILCLEKEGQRNYRIGISQNFDDLTILAGEQGNPDFE